MITRSDMKKLVEQRLKDAHILMAGQRYQSAYYIAGYAVECAIKACIAKQFRKNTIPDKGLVNETYRHDFEKLLKAAGLFNRLEEDIITNKDLGSSWDVVKDWTPDIRYKTGKTKKDAGALIDAIENENDGILPWLTHHW